MILLFKSDCLASLRRDVGTGKSVDLKKLGNLTASAEGVLNTYTKNGNGALSRNNIGNSRAETADNGVLLSCNDSTGRASQPAGC